MIGKLLSHTQVQTMARYAHLAADPVWGSGYRAALQANWKMRRIKVVATTRRSA